MFVIYRKDFIGNKTYVKGYTMTYDINEADKFKTEQEAKDVLRHNILVRIDFNLSADTLNRIMSHYNIEEINVDVKLDDIAEATKLALQNKI